MDPQNPQTTKMKGEKGGEATPTGNRLAVDAEGQGGVFRWEKKRGIKKGSRPFEERSSFATGRTNVTKKTKPEKKSKTGLTYGRRGRGGS